jgi:hypothetical protein
MLGLHQDQRFGFKSKRISAIGKWFDEKLKKHTSKSSENIEIVLY